MIKAEKFKSTTMESKFTVGEKVFYVEGPEFFEGTIESIGNYEHNPVVFKNKNNSIRLRTGLDGRIEAFNGKSPMPCLFKESEWFAIKAVLDSFSTPKEIIVKDFETTLNELYLNKEVVIYEGISPLLGSKTICLESQLVMPRDENYTKKTILVTSIDIKYGGEGTEYCLNFEDENGKDEIRIETW